MTDPNRALAQRLLNHLTNGTTDQADEISEIAVSNYEDADQWSREMASVFNSVPLVSALSAQIVNPGDYRAVEMASLPVLTVRQPDGSVRAFANVCRHRGSIVVSEGCGSAKRFTCPYHRWSYDRSGSLVGIPGREVFGEIDDATRSLTELACEERCGLVFVMTDPSASLDLDVWLAGYETALDDLHLSELDYFCEREVTGPNWKVAFDGYVDGYHLDKLHRKTLGRMYLGSAMTVDAWGPHQRVAFPTRKLAKLTELPEGDFDAVDHIGLVHTIFPHVSIAGGHGQDLMVSQLIPGPTPELSRTIQTHLVSRRPETDEDLARATAQVDFLERVVRDEDYATG
ncbi:MAG: aromatic ring-hydroxylating dioxygenase subunit alpha, partial [Acidobacteria bacterium]|nr:aromatic ring-hydroxylating dioxygenase subunit alpha [Acidobacteriota bacterium]